MGSLIFGVIILGAIIWIMSMANSAHDKRANQAVCPNCRRTGARRILKGSTTGRHQCNHCNYQFNH